MSTRGLNLVGLHFHIGSLIYETEPYVESVKFILNFAADMKKKYGFILKELDTGGGFAIQYTIDNPAPPFASFAEALTSAIKAECKRLKLELPRLVIEPGRSIVAQSGVALYMVGVVKDIPGIRTYVSVDGGMGDNIRPALYQARLEAVVANRMRARMAGKVTISGKFCESGDILIRDIELPTMKAGDILAVAGAGAYSIPESMNYNAFYRPPVILVKDSKARLIRRRETLEDITRCDIV
jgi:diaminopimelate decarboxylase